MLDIRSLDSKIILTISDRGLWSSRKIKLLTGQVIQYEAEFLSDFSSYLSTPTEEINPPFRPGKGGFVMRRIESYNGNSVYRFGNKIFKSINECQQAATIDFEDRINKNFTKNTSSKYDIDINDIRIIIDSQRKIEAVANQNITGYTFNGCEESGTVSITDKMNEYLKILCNLNKLLEYMVESNNYFITMLNKRYEKSLKENIFLSLMDMYRREEEPESKQKISDVIAALNLH